MTTPNPSLNEELQQKLAARDKRQVALEAEDDDEIRAKHSQKLAALEADIGVLRDQIERQINQGDGSLYVEGDYYADGKRPPNKTALRHEYLRVLADNLSDLSSLSSLDKNRASPTAQSRSIRLTNVYTSLNTTEQVRRQVPKRKPDQPDTDIQTEQLPLEFDERNEPLRALEAVRERRWGVLLGEPGSGKSTFAQYVVLCLSHLLEHSAEEATQPEWLQGFLQDWGEAERDLLPIWVTLREFAAALAQTKLPKRATPEHLYGFIASKLKGDLLGETLDELVLPALKDGKAFVLLDGLDEVLTTDLREFICKAIEAFAKRYPDARFLLTCRTRSYLPSSEEDQEVYPHLSEKDFPPTRLADFDDKQIERFIQAWHAELAAQKQDLGQAEINRRRDKLQSEIPRRPHLRELAGNPLLLTLMAWIHTFTNELPEKRAAFYESATRFLLWEWDQQKHGTETPLNLLAQEPGIIDGPKKIERALWQAAFAAQGRTTPALRNKTNEEIVPDVDERALTDALSKIKLTALNMPDRNWADRVVHAIKHRSGLLKPRLGQTLTFPHRTFQEYFAAKHLMAQPDPAKLALTQCEERFDVWNEVIPLAIGIDAHVNDTNLSQTVAILRKLLAGGTNSNLSWRKAWLCGKALDDIDLIRIKATDEQLHQHVVARLTKLVTTSKLAPVERAAAGTYLAHLGDPRFDAARWHLPTDKDTVLGFVHIPAGPFCMGTRERDFYATMEQLGISKQDADKHYRDEVWPDAAPGPTLPDYFIGRYAVTVGQFKAFVEDAQHRPASDRAVQGPSNNPARYVSWYDALAYCRWLTDKLKGMPVAKQFDNVLGKGWVITLPSESEWEKAARGPLDTSNKNPKRLFAWGDDDAKLGELANTARSGINTVSAVGSFAKGVSPYGCQDLLGNVWEWTRSVFGRWDNQQNKTVDLYAYPYVAEDGRENLEAAGEWWRVLRGGSWSRDPNGARCGSRYRDLPGSCWLEVGFRVAVSPFFLKPL